MMRGRIPVPFKGWTRAIRGGLREWGGGGLSPRENAEHLCHTSSFHGIETPHALTADNAVSVLLHHSRCEMRSFLLPNLARRAPRTGNRENVENDSAKPPLQRGERWSFGASKGELR
jgi:hypothetical protein